IQTGVGYHIGMTWSQSTSTQILYVNGVPLTTASLAVNTASYANIQIGANAGSGIATDHYVSDLAIWGSTALPSANMLALATKASPPANVGTAASAWWPLGGGTNGTTPSLTDPRLSDFTENGNALVVGTGALSGNTYQAAIALSSPMGMAALVKK